MLRLLFLLFMVHSSLQAQRFPTFECTNDLGQTAEFLPANSGKPSLVFVQTKSADQEVLESWIDPLVQKFIRKSGMLDAMFESELYFLAFLNSTERMVLEKSKKKLQEELPLEMRGRCFYTSGSPDAIENLTLNAASSYIVVIAANGNILGTVQGAYTEQKMELIEDLLSE